MVWQIRRLAFHIEILFGVDGPILARTIREVSQLPNTETNVEYDNENENENDSDSDN